MKQQIKKTLGFVALIGFILIIIGAIKDGLSMLELGLIIYVFIGAAIRDDWNTEL